MDTTTDNHYFTILAKAKSAGVEAVKVSGWTVYSWFPCGSGTIVIPLKYRKFGAWLLDNGFAHRIDTKGYIISTTSYGQCMTPQVTWASAGAAEFRKHNIEATMWSYID